MCQSCEQYIGEVEVKAAGKALKCDECVKGTKYLSGAVVNGVFVGSTGRCFRCNGTGWQRKSDIRRNTYYDAHYRVVNL